MKRILRFSHLFTVFAILLVLLSVAGCVPKEWLTRGDLVHMRKGMSPGEVAALATIPPKCTIEVDRQDSSVIEVFPMSATSYYGDYYVLYREDKLIYWGYPHEFLRSEDDSISAAGKLVRQLPPCSAH